MKKNRRSIKDNTLRLLSAPFVAASFPGVFLRRFIRQLDKHTELFSPEVLVSLNATTKPQYAYCVYYAAVLAKKLGLDGISVIEFGVAGGNGLIFLESFARRVERFLALRIEVYGFDTGEGLSLPVGPQDMPYWYRSNLYQMDITSLRKRLVSAQLVLGDVSTTVDNFFDHFNPAPVAAMFNDLDLYSSTANSLRIFDGDPSRFLPRVFTYFDDVIGNETAMFGDCNGELRAITDFNDKHERIKIVPNRNLLPRYDVNYRHKIFYTHLFDHPSYGHYIGEDEQLGFELTLSLGEK